MNRLSEEAGKPIYFELRALHYDEVAWIRSRGDNMDAEVALKGVVSPKFESDEFAQKPRGGAGAGRAQEVSFSRGD